MSADIFKEADWWFNFADESFNFWPEMSWVFFSKFFYCDTKWLAWISSSEAIHFATPRLAIEGSKICPNRCLIQDFVLHARFKDGTRKGFVLDVTDCSRFWNSQFESKLNSADSATQGHNSEGM
jgi:hypothetical protein